MTKPTVEKLLKQCDETLEQLRNGDKRRTYWEGYLARELRERLVVERWISVKDRLPQGNTYVLGWWPGMGEPRQVAASNVRMWIQGEDPIDDAVWKPMPPSPEPSDGKE